MIQSKISIILAIFAFLTAIRAAALWRIASERAPRIVQVIIGSRDHIEQIEREVSEAAMINSKAALWSGLSAVFSALTSIWSSLAL